MKAILASLLATVVLATASKADVFIYRGMFKIVDPDISVAGLLPRNVNVYLIVDYDGAQYGELIFGHIEGGKRFALNTAATYSFGQVSIPRGHTESFFGNGSSSTTNPTSFSIATLVFHGKDQKLLIRKTPSSIIANRPNTLRGSGLSVTRNGSSGSFSEERFGLTYLGTATIKGNNASKSINDILNALIAGLVAKGYTSL